MSGARIGYARVSTDDQNLDLQLDALRVAGCTHIFQDHGLSAVGKRPSFERALKALRHGDTLVIWKMDRAFRSLRHALDTLDRLEAKGVAFQALTEQIDTATAMGRFVYQITNAFAELERALISERTKAGMAAARKRGVHLGRPSNRLGGVKTKISCKQSAYHKNSTEHNLQIPTQES